MYAKYDYLVKEFVESGKYQIDIESGFVYNSKWKKLGYKIKTESKLRQKQYLYIKYKGKGLKLHRIIYYAAHKKLKTKLVVNHKDGNSFNNAISNLELTTQKDNMRHWKIGRAHV